MLLIGAGGNAKAIVEALHASGYDIHAYIDPQPRDWVMAQHLSQEEDVKDFCPDFVMGLGGVTVEQLTHRLQIFQRLIEENKWNPASVIHSTAVISPSANISPGAIVLAGTIVQPNCVIDEAVIINTGAIIEHDSIIGKGTHIAPSAVVLGNCKVGQSCMIGSGAVLLPGSVVPDNSLVPALTRYPK